MRMPKTAMWLLAFRLAFLCAAMVMLVLVVSCGNNPVDDGDFYDAYRYIVSDTLNLTVGIEDICILPRGDFLYVSNPHHNLVYVVSTAGPILFDSVQVTDPRGICAQDGGGKVYVSSSSASSVAAIRTSDNTVEATIPVGSLPIGICSLSGGEYVYVANSGDSSMTVIRTSDNMVADTIALEIEPLAVCSDVLGHFIYCSGIDPESTGPQDSRLQVIQVSDNTLLPSRSSLGYQCIGMCATHMAMKDMLCVVDCSGGLLMRGWDDPPISRVWDTIGIGSGPYDVCTTSNGVIGFVTNSWDDNIREVGLSLFEIVDTIPTGNRPQGICCDPSGNRIYVVCHDSGELMVLERQQN